MTPVPIGEILYFARTYYSTTFKTARARIFGARSDPPGSKLARQECLPRDPCPLCAVVRLRLGRAVGRAPLACVESKAAQASASCGRLSGGSSQPQISARSHLPHARSGSPERLRLRPAAAGSPDERLLSSPDLHCLRQPRAAASELRPASVGQTSRLGRAGRPYRPWLRHVPSPSSSHSPHSSWQESPSVMANALAPVWPKERGPTATLQLYPTAAATALFTPAARACVRQVAGLAPQHL